jgi:hypothetical protein
VSAAKYTPGPWSFQASPAHGYRIRTSDSTSSLKFGSGDVGVVFFAGNGRSPDQCKADARLIAAVPDLLEACEEALGALNGAEYALPAYVVGALERAIAKATGA